MGKARSKAGAARQQADDTAPKRTYLKQTDVPSATLTEALRVPQAILDHYAGKPTLPLYVAKALNVDPKGSQLKLLTGAAIAFGLIEGGAQAAAITVTDLSRQIFAAEERKRRDCRYAERCIKAEDIRRIPQDV